MMVANLPTPGVSDVWGTQLNDAIKSLHLGPDTHANLPAANAVPVGSLYRCTTHSVVHRTDGSTWSDWLTSSAVGTLDDLADVDTTTTPPTNGQTLVFDTSVSLWKPGTISGGGGGTTNPLDSGTHAYEFSGTSLDAGLSLSGSYVSGDLTFSNSVMQVATRAAGSYIYAAMPVGDWTATMKVSVGNSSNAMFGFLVVDGSGNGFGAGWYNSSPDAGPAFGTVTGGAYNSSSFNNSSYFRGSTICIGNWAWYRLRKVGTTYYCSISVNGARWSPELSRSDAGAYTRVGFGSWYSTAGLIDIDWLHIA